MNGVRVRGGDEGHYPCDRLTGRLSLHLDAAKSASDD